MTVYLIESASMWYLIKAKSKQAAKSDGSHRLGRGLVINVRKASEDDIAYFINLKGEIGEA